MRKLSLLAAILPSLSLGQEVINPAFIANAKVDVPFLKPANEGLFAFEKQFRYGYMDKTGKVVIPAQYDWDEKRGSHGVVSLSRTPVFTKGQAVVRKDGKLCVIDKTGKMLSPLFDCEEIIAYDLKLNLFALRQKPLLPGSPQRCGVVDAAQKIVIGFDYDDIVLDSNLIVATYKDIILDDGSSLVRIFDNTGKKLNVSIYNNAQIFRKEGVILTRGLVENEILDLSGKKIISHPSKYFHYFSVSRGRILFYNSDLNGMGMMDLKGKVIVPGIFDKIGFGFDDFGMCQVGRFKPGSTMHYDYGYIDVNGNIVMPVNKITPDFRSDLAYGIATDSITKKMGVMDRKGKWVVPAIYFEVKFIDKLGGAWVHSATDAKWHYMQIATGKDFGTLTPYATVPYEFGEDGYALYSFKDTTFRVAFEDGTMSATISDCDMAGMFSQGLAAIRKKSTGKWGFVDSSGKVVIPCEYDFVSVFQDGISRVGKKFGNTLKGGYINTKGKVILPIEYESIGLFSDGWGIVQTASGYMYVDRNGKLTPHNLPYQQLNEFKNGLAMGLSAGMPGQPPTYAYFDNKFKVVLSLQAYFATPFLGQVAIVNRNNTGLSLINKKGETVKEPLRLSNAGFAGEGLFGVKAYKWGYMNEKGEFTIQPAYDSVSEFSNGLAKVMKNKKWGLIDQEGKEKFQIKYNDIIYGKDGMVCLQVRPGEDWGLYYPFGGQAIPHFLNFTTAFNEGKGIVRYGNKYTIIRSPLAK